MCNGLTKISDSVEFNNVALCKRILYDLYGAGIYNRRFHAVDSSSQGCFNKAIFRSVILESNFNYFILGALFLISYIMNFCLRLILNLLHFLKGSKRT